MEGAVVDKRTSDTMAQMTLVDWLDDLTVRFLLNLPPKELESIPRLCFQVEEAQWFYEDFIRPANPSLPSLNLRSFCMTLFQHCPLLSGFKAAQHLAAYEQFMEYKVRVPVRGAILMDKSMEQVLLVRGYKKGASWSFPRGKINKDEDDLDCAVREVDEETGFDLKAAGLVDANKEADGKVKSITLTMRDQHQQLFVFRGVALDTHFQAKTRKEIGGIQWYNVKDLPGYRKQRGIVGHGQGAAQTSKFYMVAPFIGHLKKWIGQQRKKDAMVAQTSHQRNLSANNGLWLGLTEDEELDTEADFTTDNGMPMPVADRSADGLKRLLSIGATAAPEPVHTSTQPIPPQNDFHSNTLLAMLKGSQHAGMTGDIPHTPFEQVDPPIPPGEPVTPQNHHPRHAFAGQQQHYGLPPQFPYSPHRLQQQEHAARHASFPATALFGPRSGQHPQPQQHGFPNLPPPFQQQIHQQQQRQHSMPSNSNAGQLPGPQLHHHGASQSYSGNSQLPQSRPASHHYSSAKTGPGGQLSSPLQALSNIARPQSGSLSHAPIGSEGAVPEPAKLPPPKLNSHSMRLLDAFTNSDGKQATPKPPTSSVLPTQRPGSQQQDSLLALFKKQSIAPGPARTEAEPAPPASTSPALTDATEKPLPKRKTERRPTLNEITRTLPSSAESSTSPIPAIQQPVVPVLKVQKSGRSQSSTQAPNTARKPVQPAQITIMHEGLAERPKSLGQLYDPGKLQKTARTFSHAQKSEAEHTQPVSILHRPTSRHASHSPKPSPKLSPKPKARITQPENGQPVPQFSILQRPGSSAGGVLRTPLVNSPLRNEAPSSTAQPQVLKRPSADGQPQANTAGQNNHITKTSGAANGKKDQLLALFGNGKLATSPGPSTITPTARHQSAVFPPGGAQEIPQEQDLDIESHHVVQRAHSTNEDRSQHQKHQLLTLFETNRPHAGATGDRPTQTAKSSFQSVGVHTDARNGQAAEVTTTTPELPPSPQLQPERKPPRQSQKPHDPQQHLLNLFTKPTSVSGLRSPGTPVSPFSLGTPASRGPPLTGKLSGPVYDSSAYASDASTAGIAAPRNRLESMASVLSGGGSGQQTPTESVSTPTEAKNMLLGYLNGVVQKEGYRSGKRN